MIERLRWYWYLARNPRYAIERQIEKSMLWIATRLPARLRLWVVVDATNVARQLYPDPSGYAGPDGITYREIHDGALRTRT